METIINSKDLAVTIINSASYVTMNNPEEIKSQLSNSKDVGEVASLQFEKGSSRVWVFLTERDVEQLKSAVNEIEEFFAKQTKIRKPSGEAGLLVHSQ